MNDIGIGKRQIIIGGYDSDIKEGTTDGKDFYNKKYNAVRCITEYGTMWVPIVTPLGGRSPKFSPSKERVIIFMVHPDYIPSENNDRDVPVEAASLEDLFGIIVNLPPQYCNVEDYPDIDDGGNLPSNTLGDTPNDPSKYYSIGTEKCRITISDDGIIIKSPGGQMIFSNEGILSTGITTIGSNGKYGILKENWMTTFLPESSKVAVEMGTGMNMAPYKFNTDKVKRLISDMKEIIGGMK